MIAHVVRLEARDKPARDELMRNFYLPVSRGAGSEAFLGRVGGWIGVSDANPLALLAIEFWGTRSALDAVRQSGFWHDALVQAQPLCRGPIEEAVYTEAVPGH
jgi:hypothetical protein